MWMLFPSTDDEQQQNKNNNFCVCLTTSRMRHRKISDNVFGTMVENLQLQPTKLWIMHSDEQAKKKNTHHQNSTICSNEILLFHLINHRLPCILASVHSLFIYLYLRVVVLLKWKLLINHFTSSFVRKRSSVLQTSTRTYNMYISCRFVTL